MLPLKHKEKAKAKLTFDRIEREERISQNQ